MKHMTRLVCCLALCSVVSNVALAERRERPARVPSTGELPVVQGVGSLTVSGEGYWHQYRYENGEQPRLSAYDSSGLLLPDGSYRYEFVAIQEVPVAADAAPESAVFVAAGGEKQPARIESGSFTMNAGVMVFN